MNWLKKLAAMFTGDEDEQEIEHPEQKQHQVPYSTSRKDEERKEYNRVEAKVSYQYPKGNFRFPIIPDEKLTVRDERPPRPKRKIEEPPIYNKREEAFTRNRPTSRTSEVTEKQEVKPRRPFQPTSIPSPVHGFQKRQPRQKEIKPNKQDSSTQLESLHQESVATNQEAFKIKQDRLTEPDVVYVNRDETEAKQVNQETEIKKIYSLEELAIHEEEFVGKSNIENSIQEAKPSIDEEIIIEETSDTEYTETDSFSSTLTEANEEDEIGGSYSDYVETDSFTSLLSESNEKGKVNGSFSDYVETDSLPSTLTEVNDKSELEVGNTEYTETDFLSSTITEENDEDMVVGSTSFHTIEHVKEFADELVLENDKNDLNTKYDSDVGHNHNEQQMTATASPQTNQPEERQTQTKSEREKALPFNVMMLGRDKQRMRERVNSYQFPLLSYLNIPEREVMEDDTWLKEQTALLDSTLHNFNVRASVVNVTQGPSVTRFEVHPEPGVKVNKITNLSDDIKLSLSAKDIRIEAPIPGKNTIGIEVPNKVSKMVYLREIVRSSEFRTNPSPMTAVLGLDISGQPVVTDLKKMPHGLIAGATGSGKSVCINTILVSLLYKATPQEVKLMLIDPKMVELAPYNDIPHLVSPVITDVKAATAALKWAVEEMERRYELFAHSGTREITRYNQLVKDHKQGEHLPYLVIVIDELADLMMVAPNDVEEAICRIAQKARACGIHLIVATQRPSVDVITGLIKANIPTRIAFSVSSQVDSRTIIDVAGAEKLLGKGDMLFLENGSSKALRLQGTFVSDEEIDRAVHHVRQQSKPNYLFHQDELVKKATIQSEEDELFVEACDFVVHQGGASTSLLQRHFRIGYNRAARLIDMMEEQGIISGNRGSKPRDILISEEELEVIQGE